MPPTAHHTQKRVINVDKNISAIEDQMAGASTTLNDLTKEDAHVMRMFVRNDA